MSDIISVIEDWSGIHLAIDHGAQSPAPLYGPFISIDRARNLVTLFYARHVELIYRIEAGELGKFLPHRSTRTTTFGILPHPTSNAVRQRIRDWWNGNPPAVWFGEGFHDGRLCRGLVLDRCETIVDGVYLDAYHVNPLDPADRFPIPCLCEDMRPADMTDLEEVMCAAVVREWDRQVSLETKGEPAQ